MILYDDRQIDRLVGRGWWYLLGGLLVLGLVLAMPRGWSGGGLTCWMVVSLGVFALRLRPWRHEPGLWMLAVLLAILLGACWVWFECLSFSAVFAQKRPPPRVITLWRVLFMLDSAAALLVLSCIVRLSASVAVKNWGLTRRRPDEFSGSPWHDAAPFDPEARS
jgi:hypothetical protein